MGEGLLLVWPVTRSVTRLLTSDMLTSDVSVVPLRLRRDAELRFVGHVATGRDTWDAVAGAKPGDRTWLEVKVLRTFEHGVANSAQTATQVIVDRDEFEGGATVGSGE